MLKSPDDQVSVLSNVVVSANGKIIATQERIDKLHSSITEAHKKIAGEEIEKQLNKKTLT